MNTEIKKIPVIGTAVMKNPHWVKRLYESIDYPVENFVIFNNGNGEITTDLEKLKLIENKFIEKLFICHLPSNLGVSCAWNLIIKSYINYPYWIIVNDDVAFTQGLLEEIFIAAKDIEVGMVHPYGGDFGQGAWDLFLIKDFVVQELGLFDENLSPAYCEDADYIMRLHNSNIKKICGLSKPYLHGTGLNTEYYEHGSQTKKSNIELSKRLDEINFINFEYLNKKWGEGWRFTSPKSLPFDFYPIHYTTFDLNFIRSKNINI